MRIANAPDGRRRNQRGKDGYIEIERGVGMGYMREHRDIAERAIGRRLRGSEVVHHINGIPWDNRPDNLIVLFHSDHSWVHAHATPIEPDPTAPPRPLPYPLA